VILYLFWKLRASVAWRGLTPIIVGLLVGIPFGIFVLVTWPQDLLLRVLGAVLVASAARAATSDGRADARDMGETRRLIGTASAGLVGLTTGALAGAFNTGGPPIIAYLYCRPGTKEERTAALQAIFAISALVRIAIMAAPPAGLYTRPVLLAVLVCLPSALLGMVAGYVLFRHHAGPRCSWPSSCWGSGSAAPAGHSVA
jgi:uncharacterized membrane protein YfcA